MIIHIIIHFPLQLSVNQLKTDARVELNIAFHREVDRGANYHSRISTTV